MRGFDVRVLRQQIFGEIMETFDWNNWQERRSRHALAVNPYDSYGKEFEEYKTDKSNKLIRFLEMGMDADPFTHLHCLLKLCRYAVEIDYELLFSEYLLCKTLAEWVNFLEEYRKIAKPVE